MKITHFADKKLKLLFPGDRERAEIAYTRHYVTQKDPRFEHLHGIAPVDFLEFGSKCNSAGVIIIGFEVYDESGCLLEVCSWENHVLEYNWEWIYHPLHKIQGLGDEILLFPAVTVELSLLRDYLST